MRLGSEFVGAGIDLISWHRVKRFLSQHSFDFLKRLLTSSEQKSFKKSRSPLQFFTRCFTAKEAYFKACGGSAMGEAGFNQIETSLKRNNRFLASSAHLKVKGEGSFFKSPDGIGAQILIWKEN